MLVARTQLPQTDVFALEYRWKDADGNYRHLLEQAVVLRDSDGAKTEIAGTLLDVTDQRKLEAQLAQAQKMDAVGKLIGGIAHDFNNLLAAVLSGLHLIERKAPLDESQRSIIDLTRRSAQQGTELVKRLLAFARKQDPQASAVPINQLVTAGRRIELQRSGAAKKTRTSTGFRPQRPQRCASTNSAMAARA